jgi:hypothetical protein
MAYQYHHCSATLPCSICLTVFLHTCLALSVLLSFMICVPCPFNAPFLFCVFQLLHTTSFYMPESLSTTPPSLLCSAYLYYLCTFFILHAQCLCMLFNVPRFCSSGCSMPLQFFSSSLAQASTHSLYFACSPRVESSS